MGHHKMAPVKVHVMRNTEQAKLLAAWRNNGFIKVCVRHYLLRPINMVALDSL